MYCNGMFTNIFLFMFLWTNFLKVVNPATHDNCVSCLLPNSKQKKLFTYSRQYNYLIIIICKQHPILSFNSNFILKYFSLRYLKL